LKQLSKHLFTLLIIPIFVMTIISSNISITELINSVSSSNFKEHTPHNSNHQNSEKSEDSEKSEKSEKTQLYTTFEARIRNLHKSIQIYDSFVSLEEFVCDGFLSKLYRPPATS
jgi:hypothetical protein